MMSKGDRPEFGKGEAMTLSNQSDRSAFGDDEALYQSIKALIERSRMQVVVQVNQTLVLTYWQVGKTIKTTLVTKDRAEYGSGIVDRLAKKLSQDYGNGFSGRNLLRMMRFYEQFPDEQILTTVSSKLSWSHFVELIRVEDDLKREFYVTMCANERWSVRVLRDRMNGMLFERTAIAKQPEEVIRQELEQLAQRQPMSPQLFIKDPYFLDFLDLKDNFSKKDLENGILYELERFLLELGGGFSYIDRQKRIQIGGRDYYIDLLFYHRKLKRLVLIELKLGEFEPAHKGQVELYLKWLSKYEKEPGEEEPIALILCGGKDAELVELMDLERDNIHVAEYWLQLPPKDVLQTKLRLAIAQAQARLELHGGNDE
jgi:predicted nuclease of restriction endonuclease-like (RecB) superfamily